VKLASYIYLEDTDKYQLACAVEVADIYYKEWQRFPSNLKTYRQYELAEDQLSEVLHSFITKRKESNRSRLKNQLRRLRSKLKRGQTY